MPSPFSAGDGTLRRPARLGPADQATCRKPRPLPFNFRTTEPCAVVYSSSGARIHALPIHALPTHALPIHALPPCPSHPCPSHACTPPSPLQATESSTAGLRAFAADQSTCRHVQLLRYFGEAPSFDRCGSTCDNCISAGRHAGDDQRDFGPEARVLLHAVRQAGNGAPWSQLEPQMRGQGSPGTASFLRSAPADPPPPCASSSGRSSRPVSSRAQPAEHRELTRGPTRRTALPPAGRLHWPEATRYGWCCQCRRRCACWRSRPQPRWRSTRLRSPGMGCWTK